MRQEIGVRAVDKRRMLAKAGFCSNKLGEGTGPFFRAILFFRFFIFHCFSRAAQPRAAHQGRQLCSPQAAWLLHSLRAS